MQTARDFLIKANLAKPGRGKFSNEAKEYLYQAINDGQRFTDWDENGRISVPPSEKNKIEKRLDSSVIDDTPKVSTPYREPMVRHNDATQIVFTHPKTGRVVVLDNLKGKPVWAIDKVTPPSYLKEYTWEMR